MGTGASPSHSDVSTPGRSVVLWGASLGIVFAAGLGVLRIGNTTPPYLLVEFATSIMLGLILATPYLAAFASLKTSAAARFALLLAGAVLAFLSVGISLAGVGVVFLPSSILFSIGAFRTYGSVKGGLAKRSFLALAALMATSVIVYSFVLLMQNPHPTHLSTLFPSLGVWTLGITALALVWVAGMIQQGRDQLREP